MTSTASAVLPPLTSRRVLAIALPMMLANVSAPLIGAVDTAIIGQSGEPHLIGAVALGATIFTLLGWGFGFLRMSTTGLTAQAAGASDPGEVAAILARAVLVAVAAGVIVIVLQQPFGGALFWLFEGSAAVEQAARQFFDIRIWGAPASFVNYALMGWFLGLGRARTALALQLFVNGFNLLLNILFVIHLGWGVPGVALGTAIAENAAAVLGVLLAWRIARQQPLPVWPAILDAKRLKRLFLVSSDILIRTLCLLAAFTFFTAQGAKAGDVVLAANAILMHFFQVSAYMLDGFESSAQTLTGQAIGARDRPRFWKTVELTISWAAVVSLIMAAIIWFAGPWLIAIMTTSEDVRSGAMRYLPWAALSPLAGFLAFQLDGIFVGATRTADLRNMMALSLALYFAAWAVLMPAFGNDGLWAALTVFFLVRAVTLGLRLRPLERAAFAV